MPRLSQEILKKLRHIQIQTTRLATDVLAGPYHSIFKGKGIEFEEVREYQPGDEVRYIDWNVTARMQHPYVKLFKEERQLAVMLLIDISSSTKYSSQKQLKSELIAEIGAVLSYSAIKNNDRIGLILFTNRVETYIPPKQGPHHVLRLIREILLSEPENHGTDLSEALLFCQKIQKQSGICFVISDFIDDHYALPMKLLAKKHDLIAIKISDPCEHAFPQAGLVQMCDLETGTAHLIDTSKLTKKFRQKALARESYLQEIANKTGMGLIHIQTDEPYLPRLRQFFKQREKRG